MTEVEIKGRPGILVQSQDSLKKNPYGNMAVQLRQPCGLRVGSGA